MYYGASFSPRIYGATEERGYGTSWILYGKLLMEACLELIKTGNVVGMQDMAAGLTSSS